MARESFKAAHLTTARACRKTSGCGEMHLEDLAVTAYGMEWTLFTQSALQSAYVCTLVSQIRHWEHTHKESSESLSVSLVSLRSSHSIPPTNASEILHSWRPSKFQETSQVTKLLFGTNLALGCPSTRLRTSLSSQRSSFEQTPLNNCSKRSATLPQSLRSETQRTNKKPGKPFKRPSQSRGSVAL